MRGSGVGEDLGGRFRGARTLAVGIVWRADQTLEALREAGVVGCVKSTPAPSRGTCGRPVRCGPDCSPARPAAPHDELVAAVRDSPPMLGADLTGDVTTDQTYVVPAVGKRRYTVVAVDLGIKSMTPRLLAERGVETHVVPADLPVGQMLALARTGIFLSNGRATRPPPRMRSPWSARRWTPASRCSASASATRCWGAPSIDTYKLTFGHRGINQPVKDLATGKVEITAHNHGFAVEARSARCS